MLLGRIVGSPAKGYLRVKEALDDARIFDPRPALGTAVRRAGRRLYPARAHPHQAQATRLRGLLVSVRSDQQLGWWRPPQRHDHLHPLRRSSKTSVPRAEKG